MLNEWQDQTLEELITWSERPIFCKKCGQLKQETIDHHTYMQPCRCDRERRQEIIDAADGTPKSRDESTFDRYYARTNEQKHVKEKCSEFANGSWRGKWLILMGTPGTGKTHLATATFKRILQQGNAGVFVPYQNLIGEIKNARVNRLNDREMLAKYKFTTVLFIDDLFKGSATAADRSILNEVLDHRYANKSATILTTNLTFDQLADLDTAMLGRIVEMTDGERVLICEWGDHRLGVRR